MVSIRPYWPVLGGTWSEQESTSCQCDMLSENIWFTWSKSSNYCIFEEGKKWLRKNKGSRKIYYSEDEDLCVRPHISHCGNLRLFYGRSLSSGNSCEQLRQKAPIYKSTFQTSSLYPKKLFLWLVVLGTKILSFDKENLFGKYFHKSELFSCVPCVLISLRACRS